jgi:uncharacterized delta-60 repeat protein
MDSGSGSSSGSADTGSDAAAPLPGTVDYTFGNSGVADFATAGFYPIGVAIQRDGKIAVAGTVPTAGGPVTPVVVRFTADGLLDTTYNQSGLSVAGPQAYGAPWAGVAIEPDPTTPSFDDVVVGTMTTDDKQYQVTRFTQSGALDTSFGGGTVTHVPFAGTGIYVTSLAVDPSGDIFVGGYENDGCGEEAPIAAFTNTGAVYSGWPGGLVDFGSGLANTTVFRLGWLPNQHQLVVLGTITTTNYLQNWTVDTTGIGATWSDPASITATTNYMQIAVDPTRGVVETLPGVGGILVYRLTPAGVMDTTFNGGQPVATAISGSDDPGGLVVQQNGSPVLEVMTNGSGAGTSKIAVLRYTPAGVLDTTFGSLQQPGVAVNVFGNTTVPYQPVGLGLQPDGRIVACAIYTTNTQHIVCTRLWE